MKWSSNLYLIGLFFIISGMLLIFVTSYNFENGFFFFFPFFFFGGSGVSISMYFLLGLVFFISFLVMCVFPALINRSVSEGQAGIGYMAVGSYCNYCRNPIPVNATYCPICGSPVNQSKQPI